MQAKTGEPIRTKSREAFWSRDQCTMLRVTDPPEPSCETVFKTLISSHKRTALGAELCGARIGPRTGSPSAVAPDISAGVIGVRGRPLRRRRTVAVLPCTGPKNIDAGPLADAVAYIGTTIHAAATLRKRRRYRLALVSFKEVDPLISALPVIEVSDCQLRALRMRCFESASVTPKCQYYMCGSFEQVDY